MTERKKKEEKEKLGRMVKTQLSAFTYFTSFRSRAVKGKVKEMRKNKTNKQKTSWRQ